MPVLDLTRSDETLLAAVAQGDRDAFAVFHGRHVALALACARRMLNDDGLAEEVTQDAFVNLWRGCAGYDRTRASPTTWLLSIVRHRAIDCWRRESQRPPRAAESDVLGAHLIAADDIEAQSLVRERGREMVARVAGLPDTQRDVIVLGYYRGLTHAEIARELGLPAGTAKSRIRLGLGRLRVSIDADAA